MPSIVEPDIQSRAMGICFKLVDLDFDAIAANVENCAVAQRSLRADTGWYMHAVAFCAPFLAFLKCRYCRFYRRCQRACDDQTGKPEPDFCDWNFLARFAFAQCRGHFFSAVLAVHACQRVTVQKW